MTSKLDLCGDWILCCLHRCKAIAGSGTDIIITITLLVLISPYYHSKSPTHHDVRVLYFHWSSRPWTHVARTEKVLHHTSCHSAEDLEPQNFGDRRLVLVRWVIGLVEQSVVSVLV